MRAFLAALLFLLPMGALADNTVGQCPAVREESFDRISCTLITRAYNLEYHNKLTYRLARWNRQYQEMIDTLCRDAEIVIEHVDARVIRTIRCPKETE